MSTQPSSRKQAAIDFLRLVAKGEIDRAYRTYVATNFRHHNPFFRSDAASLQKGMEENARQNPNKELTVLRAIEEGDLVATHSLVKQRPGDRGGVVVHLFRFQGDRVAELWDIGQPVPETMPNELGMI